MLLPSELRFKLINNLSPDDVKKCGFVIYAHSCTDGTYVGLSADPVKRWQEHLSDALNEHSQYYNDNFKVAIRKHKNNFGHYVLAVANFPNAAKKKEAAAIRFYGKNLNIRQEAASEERDYGFRPIDASVGVIHILNKKGRSGTTHSRSDAERKTVIGEIYIEFGRKRVRSIEGQPFQAGINIRCSKDERDKFEPGDKVRIKVALSERDGTPILEAAKTSKLVRV